MDCLEEKELSMASKAEKVETAAENKVAYKVTPRTFAGSFIRTSGHLQHPSSAKLELLKPCITM